jgi:hypothetical protein
MARVQERVLCLKKLKKKQTNRYYHRLVIKDDTSN